MRAVLGDLRDWLGGTGAPDAACGSVEIALAEALNNVVEHAYGARPPPDPLYAIRIDVTRSGAQLEVCIRDFGAALPGLALPEGRLPDANVARDALPEGGFGWFLIRELTTRLHYVQVDGENCLELSFNLNSLSD